MGDIRKNKILSNNTGMVSQKCAVCRKEEYLTFSASLHEERTKVLIDVNDLRVKLEINLKHVIFDRKRGF